MDNKEPKIEDYLDIMSQFESGPLPSNYNYKFWVYIDENGKSEFMDNFFKEAQELAKNYGK